MLCMCKSLMLGMWNKCDLKAHDPWEIIGKYREQAFAHVLRRLNRAKTTNSSVRAPVCHCITNCLSRLDKQKFPILNANAAWQSIQGKISGRHIMTRKEKTEIGKKVV